MSNPGADDDGPRSSLPWDQRVVRSMTIADSARNWAIVLRVVAGVVAAASLIGGYILYFVNDQYGDPGVPNRLKVGQLLQSAAIPLGLAGLILALSFFVTLTAARLDLDIVLSDEDETGAA